MSDQLEPTDASEIQGTAGQPATSPAMAPAGAPAPSNPVRTSIGLILFTAWAVMEVIWIWTNLRSVIHGDAKPLITMVIAVAMLIVLGCFEGLEVSVIDRSEELWPGQPTSYLAGWLAARQLFVALIVTTATLLANRSILFIPFATSRITGSLPTGAFDTVLTGLTVLWFGQILPKVLGAMNPDRYLARLRRPLFPIVHGVYLMGVSQPGEWVAAGLGRSLHWMASPDELARLGPGQSHTAIWRELISHRLGHHPHLIRRRLRLGP